jgi:hypothetical protein
MKNYILLGLVITFLWLWAWCENKITLSPEVDKEKLIQYCEDNWWYFWETDWLVCYFFNSSCPALDFYNGDCLPKEESNSSYDENQAIKYCEESYWMVNELEIWWEIEKICFFPDQSVCSLKEIFYWECDNKIE